MTRTTVPAGTASAAAPAASAPRPCTAAIPTFATPNARPRTAGGTACTNDTLSGINQAVDTPLSASRTTVPAVPATPPASATTSPAAPMLATDSSTRGTTSRSRSRGGQNRPTSTPPMIAPVGWAASSRPTAPVPPISSADSAGAMPSWALVSSVPIHSTPRMARRRGEVSTSRGPARTSAHSEAADSPSASTGAGRARSPAASRSPDSAKAAALSSSPRDGDSTVTSAPPSRKPTTWANCTTTVPSEVATA